MPNAPDQNGHTQAAAVDTPAAAPPQQHHLKGQPAGAGKFRPPGAPAGSFPPTPWWHCVFIDPYESVNVWSHGVPGCALLLLGLLAWHGSVPGGAALWVFCLCAATTHLLSALTHVYPDDHFLEKLDHVGIVVLIVGTPVSQMMALDPEHDLTKLLVASMCLLGAAFLPPLLRTCSFVGIVTVMVVQHWTIVDVPLLAQCALYVGGAVCFVRNGGHERLLGLQDHHILHYKVTLACCIHVANVVWRASSRLQSAQH